jgi:hypothetical protein
MVACTWLGGHLLLRFNRQTPIYGASTNVYNNNNNNNNNNNECMVEEGVEQQ